MGSYAQITIGGYPIYSTKNFYDRWYFRKKDRVIRTRPKSERNTLIWSPADENELGREETDYLYVCSSSVLRHRLELAGFNRETLEREFKQSIAERIAERTATSELFAEREPAWVEVYAESIATLRSSSLSDWLVTLKTAVDERIPSSRWDDVKDKYPDPLLHLFFGIDEFSDDPAVHDTGFPCKTLECMAVAMLEIMPADVECALDVTDLVSGGWTDSFEDLIEYQQEHTTFYEVFATAVEDARSLIALAPENKTLVRLLYANVITAMETYLSDTLKKQVLTREAIRRRFVQTNEAFKEKIVVQDIFRKLESLSEEIVQAIDVMSFHNLDKTLGLYKSVLDTHFPGAGVGELKKAIEVRHHIVHRNGKTTQGKSVEVTKQDVEGLIALVDSTLLHIDEQIKDGLLDDDEREKE